MLNRLADRIRSRTSTDAPAPVNATQAHARREFHIGDDVRAQVAAPRPDGIASVTIEGQPFLLRLPFNARAGDWIRLTVSAREPRLKFELSEAPHAPPQPARISETARFITALLAESEKLPVASTAVTHAPLVHGPPLDTAALASALADALAGSGMFYESHQAQWVAGTRTRASLLNEPQARIPTAGPTPVAVIVHDPSTEPAPPLATPASSLDNVPVHRDALPIVRQQLETLETRHLMWHGMVWQDQSVTWRIEEHPSDNGTVAVQPSWRTHIALTLPGMGDIRATLRMDPDATSIMIHAITPETVAELATHRATLHRLLYQAGLRNIHVTIDADEVR